MSLNKTIAKAFEINKKIKIMRHNTLEELLAAEYDLPIEELRLCKHGGFDGNGKEWEFDFDELIAAIKSVGCYGFVKNNTDIHVWISKDANVVDIISLLAHERGHLIMPNHKNPIQEETKAELYSLCAEFAYCTYLDLDAMPNERN